MSPIVKGVEEFFNKCVSGLEHISKDNHKTIATAVAVGLAAASAGLFTAVCGAGASSFFIAAFVAFATLTAISYAASEENPAERAQEFIANLTIFLKQKYHALVG